MSAPQTFPDLADRTRLADFLIELALAKPKESPITRQVFEWALDLDRHSARALNGLGRCLLVAKEWGAARACFAQALEIEPENPLTCVNAALAHDHLKELDRAERLCWQALTRNGDYIPAYIELFGIYERRKNYNDARLILESGLQSDPQNHELLFARATLGLKGGEFDQGWIDYEHRPTKLTLNAAMDEYPEWDGSPLDGKTIMVVREQGLGDEIMFSRYVPWLPGAGRVVVYTYPELARLFAAALPSVEIITSDRAAAAIPIDCWVAMGSLPLRFQASLLGAPPQTSIRLDEPAGVPHTVFRIGLSWRGNPKQARDEFRSMEFERLKPLLDVPGCEFVSLQYGDEESDLPKLCDYGHDFLDRAASIADLDLVITVDTAMAHLAGSMGKPVWILLYNPSDWRWGIRGDRSDWYPSARLFRDVSITKLRQELEAIAPAREQANMTIGDQAPAGGDAKKTGFGHPEIISRECRYGTMSWLANDHYIGRALDLYGEYSESEVELMRRFLQPGNVVVDAGANVGGLTLPIFRSIGRAGAVWAFEPQPAYYRLLAQNMERAGNVNSPVRQQALGAECKTITIRATEECRRFAPGWTSSGPEIEVQQVTIDSLPLMGCRLIKIDVDGQELEILQGAEQTIAKYRPLLYVENDKPDAYPDLAGWLDRHGYRLYQHYAPLYNPQNFRSNPINVFGGVISAMILCVPTERKDVHPVEWGLARLRAVKRES